MNRIRKFAPGYNSSPLRKHLLSRSPPKDFIPCKFIQDTKIHTGIRRLRNR